MKFSLKNTKVTKIQLAETEEQPDKELSLTYSLGTSKDKDNEFVVIFEIGIYLEEKVHLFVELYAIFETDSPIPEEFMGSNVAKINTPAIAYPYIRSFISMLTLNAGYEPLMLPTINFVELAKQQEEQSQNSQ